MASTPWQAQIRLADLSLRQPHAVGAEDIAAGDDAEKFPGMSLIDHHESADVLLNHSIGGFAQGLARENRNRRAPRSAIDGVVLEKRWRSAALVMSAISHAKACATTAAAPATRIASNEMKTVR